MILGVGALALIATFIVGRMFLSSSATRSAVKDFVTSLHQQRSRAQDAVAASRVSDPISPVNIEREGELSRRLALLQTASAANRAALDARDQWPAGLSAALKRAGASSWEISRWQKRFREQYDWEHSRPLFAARQRVIDLQIAMLRFLQDHRDAWGIVDGIAGIHFFNRDQRREYDALLTQYADAVIAEKQAGKSTSG